jgi:diguanylate cyclase (GGDEF)-like protein/PAS domain S-box-containing protein
VISSTAAAAPPCPSLEPRAAALLRAQQLRIWTQTDRLFAALFLIQWVAGIAAALWLSPRTWSGTQSTTHLHVWMAIYLGGAITLFPCALALARPAKASTRHVIAVSQMLMSGLLIQLTGGRIESHFHVFGSLAFLSFYRDWKILVPATIVIAGDHFLRGSFWPQSVFGVQLVSQWRWVEHAGWVVFENIFLTVACVRSQREMCQVAERSAELEVSEERYRSVMEQAAEGICLMDPVTNEVLECNRAFEQLLGDTGAGDLQGATAKLMTNVSTTSAATPRDWQVVRSDGSVLDLSVTVSRISFGAREVLCASVRDVTDRRRAQEALRQSEERYVRAARGANDGLWDWDLTTGEIYFSQRWKEMLGLTGEEQGSLDQWLRRIHVDDHMSFLAAVRAHLTGRTDYFEHEHRMLHADGAYRWMLCRGLAPREGFAAAKRMAGSQTDVTDRQIAAEQLRHAALHDALTRLPNRALFTELLDHAVLRGRRHEDYRFAVLFVDIDRFKVINDTLGHMIGDRLLQGIADRMREHLRAGDVVARFGGDEFTMLVDDMQTADDAHDVATRIQDALKAPFNILGHEFRVTVSIGVAVGSAEYERGEDILRDADVAMYRAKTLGRDRQEDVDAIIAGRGPHMPPGLSPSGFSPRVA